MGDDVSLATRVLCCIMGSIRGGPLAWQSLELRVLRPLNADLAACERNMKHPGKNGAVGRAIRRHANSSH